MLEPFAGLKAIWDFAKTADPAVAGIVVGNDGVPGQGRDGRHAEIRLRGLIARIWLYDGLGEAHFHAYQGRASVVVPLN